MWLGFISGTLTGLFFWLSGRAMDEDNLFWQTILMWCFKISLLVFIVSILLLAIELLM